MKQVGVEILTGATNMPAEELVAAIYEAMTLELGEDGEGASRASDLATTRPTISKPA
jgi:hypothetical protein